MPAILLYRKQDGKLVKQYLTPIDLVGYQCNLPQRAIVIGWVDSYGKFNNIPSHNLTPSESYIQAVPNCDFSMFNEDDFRREGTLFTLNAIH